MANILMIMNITIGLFDILFQKYACYLSEITCKPKMACSHGVLMETGLGRKCSTEFDKFLKLYSLLLMLNETITNMFNFTFCCLMISNVFL